MTMIMTGVIGGLSLGLGGYEASQSGSLSGEALQLAEQQAGEQSQYNKLLMSLIQNPSQFLSNPLFTSTLNTGLQSVTNQMAAQGYAGSGNMAQALEQYGQSFASGQLLSQENLLAGLTGLSANPASAIGAATSAQGQSASELSGGMNTAAMMALLMQNQNPGGGGLDVNAMTNSNLNWLSGWNTGMGN